MLGYVAAAAAYVLIVSWAVTAGHWQSTGHWHGSFGQVLLPRINDVIVFTFFLVCGASVGSFLNVVVWRMPQGMGVNGHSFCPQCRNMLRVRDNVPLFGWLWLGGRCRDCRLPISSRYPVVEAAVGLSFAVLGTVELYGWNLPYRDGAGSYAMASPLIEGGQLIVVVYHLIGLAIAWAMGLIRYDGHRIPGRLVGFSAVVLIGGILLFPSLAVVPWQLATLSNETGNTLFSGRSPGAVSFPGIDFWPPADGVIFLGMLTDANVLVQSLVRVLAALVAAGFFARVLARAFCPTADLKLDPLGKSTVRLIDLVKLIAVIAILIGWQASSGVLIAASVVACVGARVFKNTDAMGRFSLALPVALLIQIVFWRWLSESGWWPGERASRGVLLSFCLATLFVPLWLREPRPILVDAAPPDEHSGG